MRNKLFSSKRSMYDEFVKNGKKYKDNIAITCNQNKITYSSFINKVDEYARSFYKMSINELETVTVILPNVIDTLVCIYALNKLGAISNVVHYLSSLEEIKRSINDTHSHYIITDDNKLKYIKNICDEEYIYNVIYLSNNEVLSPIDKFKNLFKKRLNLSTKYISFYRCRLLGHKLNKTIKSTINSDNIALIINNNFKRVYVTNDKVNYYADNYLIDKEVFSNNLKILTDDTIINSIPVYHRSLTHGQNIILNTYDSTKLVMDNIIKYRPNILEISGSTLEKICLNRSILSLSSVKLIICGKDKLDGNTYKKAKEIFYKSKIITTYGMIETTSNFTYNDSLDSKIDSVGIPIKDMCVKIVNVQDKSLCKANEIGQICIKGPLICSNDEWLYSDDLGYLDKDNYLYIKSNLKRIIVSNGINIYPEEIENVIKKHDYVKDAYIVGVPHPYKKEVVKVYIVLKDKYILNSEIKKSIKEYCENNIAQYALPYAYAYRHELPKTNLGKIAYQKLINENEEE